MTYSSEFAELIGKLGTNAGDITIMLVSDVFKKLSDAQVKAKVEAVHKLIVESKLDEQSKILAMCCMIVGMTSLTQKISELRTQK